MFKSWISLNLRKQILLKNKLGMKVKLHPSNIKLMETYKNLKKEISKQVKFCSSSGNNQKKFENCENNSKAQ